MQQRQQWLNVTRALKRAAVLCAALPLVAQAASAQFRDIYPDPSVAKTEIHAALARARAKHKHVILDFGGNWCGDCQVLNIYFHDPANKALLKTTSSWWTSTSGTMMPIRTSPTNYDIPLKTRRSRTRGAVTERQGSLAQTNGEFEKMTQLESSDLTKFLNDWKPTHTGTRGR